jgi:hypothetical protein
LIENNRNSIIFLMLMDPRRDENAGRILSKAVNEDEDHFKWWGSVW